MKQHTHVASCESSDSQTSSLWLDMIKSKTCERGGLKQCECGLGQTATNPVSEVFRSQYNANRVGGVSTRISVCSTMSVARSTEVRLWCVARKNWLVFQRLQCETLTLPSDAGHGRKLRPRKTGLRNQMLLRERMMNEQTKVLWCWKLGPQDLETESFQSISQKAFFFNSPHCNNRSALARRRYQCLFASASQRRRSLKER